MQKRWLLFSVLIRSTPLLSHFVRHYASLGFTDWIVAVHPSCQPVDWKKLGALSQMRIHLESCYPWPQSGKRDSLFINGLRAVHIGTPAEWHAVADIDEFYEYPLPLNELAELAKEANCVTGEFVDRVAPDGSLPPVRGDVSLSEQFPIRTQLTRRLLGSEHTKIMLCRGDNALGGGHHHAEGERIFGTQGLVHHYKWNSDVIPQLTTREGASAREMQPTYARSAQRFLDYFQRNQCINLKEFAEIKEYRVKFLMKDGRRLYPGVAKEHQLIGADATEIASIRSIKNHYAYTSSLSTIVPGASGAGYVSIANVELEEVAAPVDPIALGPSPSFLRR